MKDAEADANASGSGPSETGSDPRGSELAGVENRARETAPGAPVKAARDDEDGRDSGLDDPTAPDGRLDHHKDKKGRKRRRST